MYSLQQLQNDFIQKLTDRYTLSEAKTLFFMLLKARIGWDSTYFFLHSQEPVSSELRDCLKSDILRLQSGEPIQYLLKQVKFCNLKLKCDNRALIPRPETEELCEWIQKKIQSANCILDIGTGSGCIALALKQNYPQSIVQACDISTDSLELAIENAKHVSLNVLFFEFDFLNCNTPLPLSKYDLIVSNPPYIPWIEKQDLADTVKNFEPERALFSTDPEGVLPYYKILLLANEYLCSKGWVALELHPLTAIKIYTHYMKSSIFKHVELLNDYSGNPRFIMAQRK